MGAQTVLFSRRYRAALLDYLLGSGEAGLARAYELGRTAIDSGLGVLPILGAHHRAVNAVLESTHTVSESLKRIKAAQDFLEETLSPFEMTYRGYVASLEGRDSHRCQPASKARTRARGSQENQNQ